MRIYLRMIGLLTAILTTSPAFAAINVVSTLPDYGAMIQALGGEHVQVRVLASPFEDPHYVEAKPSFIVALNRADLLIMNGLEQEIGWLPPLLVQARNPRIQRGQAGHLEVANFVKNLLDVPQGHIDRSMGDIHVGGNPHYYHDPIRMAALLPVFTKRLIELAPAHSADFRRNLAQEETRFIALIARIKAAFGRLPPQRRRVVAYHQSLSYLFETLGMTASAYLEPKPGIAPTPGHLAKILRLMKRDGVNVIVQEAHYPSKTSSTLIKITRGSIVVFPGGTKMGQTYLQHVEEIASAILSKLGGGTL